MANLTLFTLAYELGMIRSIALFSLAFLISALISFFYLRRLKRSLISSLLAFLFVFLSSIFISNLPIYLMLYSILGYFVLGITTGIISILFSAIYSKIKKEKSVKTENKPIMIAILVLLIGSILIAILAFDQSKVSPTEIKVPEVNNSYTVQKPDLDAAVEQEPIDFNMTLKTITDRVFNGSAGILTKNWNAENFAGFWRDSETGASTETLVINQSVLNSNYRIIEKHNLIYATKPAPLKYKVYTHANKTPPNTNGFYSAIGWLGEKYVFLQENRLARIIFEQKAADVKTMHTRESWSLGYGYKIAANSIDVPLRGEEQAWIAFFKDNTILEDKILPNNSLYSYPETATGAPVFVTYTANIYRLPQEDVADFKYTWLRSQNVTEIKEGDIFGIMEVTSVKNNIIELRNKEPIKLTPGTAIPLMGNMGIQVGGSETDLLFYPTMGW